MPSDLTRSSLDVNKCFYSWDNVDTEDFLTLYVRALRSIETSGTIHAATQRNSQKCACFDVTPMLSSCTSNRLHWLLQKENRVCRRTVRKSGCIFHKHSSFYSAVDTVNPPPVWIPGCFSKSLVREQEAHVSYVKGETLWPHPGPSRFAA